MKRQLAAMVFAAAVVVGSGWLLIALFLASGPYIQTGP